MKNLKIDRLQTKQTIIHTRKLQCVPMDKVCKVYGSIGVNLIIRFFCGRGFRSPILYLLFCGRGFRSPILYCFCRRDSDPRSYIASILPSFLFSSSSVGGECHKAFIPLIWRFPGECLMAFIPLIPEFRSPILPSFHPSILPLFFLFCGRGFRSPILPFFHPSSFLPLL